MNQIIKSNGHSAKCVMQADKGNFSHFLAIKERFASLYPERHAVSNGECPFFSMNVEVQCPFFSR